jgi:hypothetical protein
VLRENLLYLVYVCFVYAVLTLVLKKNSFQRRQDSVVGYYQGLCLWIFIFFVGESEGGTWSTQALAQ